MNEIVSAWNTILPVFEIKFIENVTDHETSPINKLCWHCCHVIPNIVLQYPFSHDDKRGTFKVGGQFCSWECIKGFSRDKISSSVSGIHQMNIRYYRKKITGLTDPVCAAPPFMTLKAFGGHLTIEEFRKPVRNVDYNVNYAKLVKVIPYQTMEYKFEEKHKQRIENKSLNIDVDHTTQIDCLKLRRPKPMAKGKGTLERVLGLNNFGNFIKQKS
ncbi:MYM-type zinc finger with FCS sequencing motif, VLTF2 type transcription factor [Only Syngen Nebraska virus 5]|uniref:MYM-type zinc finger with FCS sequencing motif, VLTF2 type transcription factor n=1 Tax=Only Syngen Nebraska virus 5 TaxID=1917232 RepID=UPI000901F316|nr:MYM-type zinc finger with FCS sequencing motif, VLTF2 type transcription factor [Only Syngen Nebraska virus 5]APC25763.1 MYM-type zinc finger with FCS sequencing motif, VLTF2 type transcription factor [Only Syngen Nebraska virus 5]